jgi:tRNA-dihydrouridine synthase
MAPMVAASDYPFRVLLRELGGVDLLFTQMLHAKNFVNDANFRKWHCDFFECGMPYPDFLLPTQQECLGGNNNCNDENNDNYNTQQLLATSPVLLRHNKPRPLFAPLMVQLAGHEVEWVVQAALMICEQTEGKIAGIDLVSNRQISC